MNEPAADSVPAPARYPAPDPASARDVFVAWEKLRILYNGVLAAVVITVTAIEGLKVDAELAGFVFGCAVAANLAYCAGPVAEGYAALVGVPRRACRIVLITLGLLVAASVALAAMISFSTQGF